MPLTPSVMIQDAKLSYQSTVLFDQFSLTLLPNKITCLLGKSGVGKTSLLRLIAGLTSQEDMIFSGKIFYGSKSTCETQIAYMAQTDLLLPWLTAFDNALLGFRLRNNLTEKILLQAKNLFHKMKLHDAEKKYPQKLSGGMRQRVALIRTLLEEKPIVLMDEPFSSLDAITRYELQNFAVDFLKDKTVLMVTHDPMEALRIADEIIVLGGTPAHVIMHIVLDSAKPRNLNDAEVIQNQQKLFAGLMNT